jgi:hypothetical protein
VTNFGGGNPYPPRTPWFPAVFTPERIGWYEYKGQGIYPKQRKQFWNGHHWVYEARPFLTVRGSDYWRGLTAPWRKK